MSLDEKYMDLFRPKVHWGKIEIDVEKCIGCGQCVENCPGKVPALDENEKAYMGREECITCSNCVVTCPEEAISIKETFFVEDGYYKTVPADIPYKPPAPPLDAEGNPAEYTAMEKAVLERRSNRNFKDEPVPEHLIRRILEAGRHAPSTGNCQPWRFIVITDTAEEYLTRDLPGRKRAANPPVLPHVPQTLGRMVAHAINVPQADI